ncbi:MAG: hypothetical protein UV53_C0026G0006 [Candidatus Azambacteria bacterium GW2011_GWE1_42_9]|nr:MAG: hypothetical protein UV53_C0026G0006 [Candidatus Azambacteria bacterium GW2011_GWE1_42_9]
MSAVIAFLQTHSVLAYPVLFLGSYADTFIGIGFFIYGEIFFIAGSVLAGAGVLDIWLVALALYLGGILGDTSSYFIGLKYGASVFKNGRRIFSIENYKKGKKLFHKHGNKGIFLARFMGPLSWVTPFFAGVYKVPYRYFFYYNMAGVILAISQFLIIGYAFGANWQYILSVIQYDMRLVFWVFVIVISLYFVVRKFFKNKNQF